MTATKFPNNNNERNAPTMTELLADGSAETRRFTDFARYPLPPARNREGVEVDRWERYKLPSPTTGKVTAFTRATTVAKTTSSDMFLTPWKIREKVFAMLRAREIRDQLYNDASKTVGYSDNEVAMGAAFASFEAAVSDGTNGDVNKAIDLIHDLAGGADARELGIAVHDWLAELDMGLVLQHQLPEFMGPYVTAYQDALSRAGLIAEPIYVERVVLNDRGEESIAGRLDRIYRCQETGELYLGDIKTSKSTSIELDSVLLEWAVQFATYGYATKMLSIDGQQWEDMPEVNQEMCVVLHIPSDQPERSQVIPFDLWAGGEALIAAINVRKQRKEVPKKVLTHTTPIPSAETLRYVAARQAIQNITSVDDAVLIREEYQDVWTDALTEFGAACFELIDPNPNPDTEE